MKSKIKKINQYFESLSLKKKLIGSFYILILLPVFIISFQSYILSKDLLEEKTSQYTHDIIYQTTNNIERSLKKITDITFNIIANKGLQQIIDKINWGVSDQYESMQNEHSIENLLSSYALFQDEIDAIFIVADTNRVYSLNKTGLDYDIKQDEKDDIYANKGDMIWYDTDINTKTITVTRAINSLRTQRPIGYIVIVLKEQYVYGLFSETQYVGEGSIFILNSNHKVVSSKDKSLLGRAMKEVSLKGVKADSQFGFYKAKIKGEHHYISYSETMNNGWKLVSIVPANQYLSQVMMLRNSILIVAVLVAVLAVSVAVLISKSISTPISKLSEAMIKFGKGDFSANSEIYSDDEIGRLSQSFNRMVEDIQHLIETVYKEQLLKQRAQLKSLQMQINPHFLYNTLETINWMARIKGASDIGSVVKSLGDLMRTTISGSDFISIRDEIKGLNNYLNIQRCRYGDKFDAIITIDPVLYEIKIPKLIIQPIVENAIVHGIEQKIGKGTVSITGKIEEDIVNILIEDDGIGMTSTAINKVLENSDDLKSEGHTLIGINNVDKRIRMYYGERYGLQIQTVQGEGTKMTIRFPASSEIAQNNKKGKKSSDTID